MHEWRPELPLGEVKPPPNNNNFLPIEADASVPKNVRSGCGWHNNRRYSTKKMLRFDSDGRRLCRTVHRCILVFMFTSE